VLQARDTNTPDDGAPGPHHEQLGDQIAARAPGTVVTHTVEDAAGAVRQVPVTLAARPDDPTKAFLGVGSATRDFDPGLPFPIEIDTGDVGGPSAGLAFTLTLLDLLSPGELTGGGIVAVTGTINPDGTVGPVGGVVQKAAVAAAEGATLFLVPDAELEAARSHSHGMEVVAVSDVDEALAALQAHGGDPLG
jgi:PDZ domain-containing protein